MRSYLTYHKKYCTNNFCRTMLASSAAFAVMRCLSVCLSRSYILSKRVLISSDFFTVTVTIILVFPYETGRQYSDGNPPNVGIECKVVYKITIFD